MRCITCSFLMLLVALSQFVACSQPDKGKKNESTITSNLQQKTPCTPLETREANAPNQQPTFAGQTRACAITTKTHYTVEEIVTGLEKPWSVEPLPDGTFLITEKPGRMIIVHADGKKSNPLLGLPAVDNAGQGGLLDVALSPDFATDRTLYWSFSEPRQNGNATSVAKGMLSADKQKLEQVRVIFRSEPAYNGALHFGSRITFGPDKNLYLTLGERSDLETRPQAQQLSSHLGKVIRITKDGKPVPDNPFINLQRAKLEIWTLGHRNIQAAAFDRQGQLWTVEMGPQGGDELNLIMKGKNYGWPLVTFGEEYAGVPVPDAVTTKPGFEDPIYYWDPVIAPSGAQFYSGKMFKEWKGDLFVGALRGQTLVRLQIVNNRVVGEEHLIQSRGQRIRDVKEGLDGALYLVTDQHNGQLLKIIIAE